MIGYGDVEHAEYEHQAAADVLEFLLRTGGTTREQLKVNARLVEEAARDLQRAKIQRAGGRRAALLHVEDQARREGVLFTIDGVEFAGVEIDAQATVLTTEPIGRRPCFEVILHDIQPRRAADFADSDPLGYTRYEEFRFEPVRTGGMSWLPHFVWMYR